MAVPQFFGLAFLGLPLIFDWKLVKTKYFEFIQRIFENVKIDLPPDRPQDSTSNLLGYGACNTH